MYQEEPIKEPVLQPNSQVFEEHGYCLTANESRRKTVQRVNIILEGELSLKNVAALGIRLRTLLQQYEYLNIQLKGVEELDLPVVQLFWHLKRSGSKAGKTVVIAGEVNQQTRDVIKLAGLHKVISEK